MLKGPLLVMAALAVPAAAFAQAAPPPRAAGEATVKIRVAHFYDENYPWHKAYERFRDVVQKKTGGSVEVQIFAGPAFGTEKDYVSLLRQGALDIATVSPAAIAIVAPEVSFFDLMYLFRDYDHWRSSLDGKLGKHMAELIRKATSKAGTPGFEVLGYWSGMSLNIVGRARGYQAVDDLLGMKIRTQGVGIQTEQWKALGARPLMVPYDGVYAAFKDGAIDATPGVIPSVYSMKFHEVAPHVSETTHNFIVRICVMSGHTWMKLNAEQRLHVMDAAREATAIARTLEAEQNQELTQMLKTKHGVKFYPFRDKEILREKTATLRRRFAAENNLTELLAGLEAEWDRTKAK